MGESNILVRHANLMAGVTEPGVGGADDVDLEIWASRFCHAEFKNLCSRLILEAADVAGDGEPRAHDSKQRSGLDLSEHPGLC